MQFHPILASNVLPLVVRGLVALWLWCPHLLIDIDCIVPCSTLAWADTRHHAALHTHISMQYTHSSTHGLANTITYLHSVRQSHSNCSTHKNTHIHTLSQTLAAGMAMCTNTLTFSHPRNLCTQKPRTTTSLCSETQELCRTTLCVHSSIPNHALSSPPSLFKWAFQFRMITLLSHMIDNPEIRDFLT